MNGIVAFFSRCLLFGVFVVVSKFENLHVEFDMFQRVVLTCLQICVLCGVNQQAAVSQRYAESARSPQRGPLPGEEDDTLPYRPVRVAE